MNENAIDALAHHYQVKFPKTMQALFAADVLRYATDIARFSRPDAGLDETLTCITDALRYDPTIAQFTTDAETWLALASRPEGTDNRMPRLRELSAADFDTESL